MVPQPRDSGPIAPEDLSSPAMNLREPRIYGHFWMRVPALDTVTQPSESRKSTLAVAAQVSAIKSERIFRKRDSLWVLYCATTWISRTNSLACLRA